MTRVRGSYTPIESYAYIFCNNVYHYIYLFYANICCRFVRSCVYNAWCISYFFSFEFFLVNRHSIVACWHSGKSTFENRSTHTSYYPIKAYNAGRTCVSVNEVPTYNTISCRYLYIDDLYIKRCIQVYNLSKYEFFSSLNSTLARVK